MEMSQEIANLAEALAKFQGEVIDPVKNSTANTGRYSFNYAGLDAIVKAVRPVAAKYGLGFMQYPINESYIDAKGEQHMSVGIVTMLIHSSGEWMKSDPFVVPVAKQDAQGYGSCITYAKRYSLAAVLGISADEDDDGNIGCGTPADITHKQAQNGPAQGKPTQSKPAPQTKTAQQVKPMNPTAIPGIQKGADSPELLATAKQMLAGRAQELGINFNDVLAELQKRFKKKAGFTANEYAAVYDVLPSMVKAG